MTNRKKLRRTALRIWRAGRAGPAAIAAQQGRRLQELVAFATEHSPYYRKLYAGLVSERFGRALESAPTDGTPDSPIEDMKQLPPVTKAELMANFDDWVTDPEVTRASVEDFVDNKSLIGHPYLGRYAVWLTSGVTGLRGLYVNDSDALRVYAALMGVRGVLSWVGPLQLWRALGKRRRRIADVLASTGHLAAVTVREVFRIQHPQSSENSRVFSALDPVPELVQGLNEFQPTVLMSYATALDLLAHEQDAGRLRIRPTLIISGAERLGPTSRERVSSAFGCPVRDTYAAAEFMGIASDCRRGRLHVNSDWVILEPVDEAYQPVPAGEPSHTVLVTNLANRVQPIIRYDLGDSVVVNPDRCSCGSPFPPIEVQGRSGDLLKFRTSDGSTVELLPIAIAAAIVDTGRLLRFQVIQKTPQSLNIRLEANPGEDVEDVWRVIAGRLRDLLARHNLAFVRVERDPEPPRRDPATGKFIEVWSEVEEGQ